MPSAPSPASRFSWAAPLCALAGVAVYLNALGNPFVYDDRTTIVNNPSIRHLGNLGGIFRFDPKRPVVNFSYALNYAWSGLSPLGYQLTNVLLHALNIVLLFHLVERALEDSEARRAGSGRAPSQAALAAALLCAVHPLLSEAIGYTSARSGVLCASFSLAALLCMRRGLVDRRPRWVAAALAAMVFGMACKETAALLPFAFVAYDWLLLPSDPDARRRRLLRLHLPLVALIAVAGGARLVLFARLELSGIRPFSDHLLTQLPIFWRYFALFVAPLSLSLAHSVRVIHDPFDGVVVISVAALLVILAAAWRIRRRAPAVTFGVVWYLLFMAPSSIIPLAEHMSEHRTYEASFGLFIIAGVGWSALRARYHRGAQLAGVAALLAMAALTLARNRVWSAPISLWQDAVAKAPDLWTAHYALANEYQYDGQFQNAITQYGAAIRLQPSQRAIVNVGTCLAQLGRLDEAARMYQMALQVGPGPDPYFNLGLLEVARHHPAEARDDFLQVIALDANNLLARKALVDLYDSELHDPPAALRLCREIAAIDPTTDGVAECLRAHAAP